MYILMDIGCVECGGISRVVLMTDNLSKAQRLQGQCEEQYGIVSGGKHKFMILDAPEKEEVNDRYTFGVEKPPKPRPLHWKKLQKLMSPYLCEPRIPGVKFAPLMDDPIGRNVIQKTCSLLMKKPTPESLIRDEMPVHREVVEEAILLVLMDSNPGLNKTEMEKLVSETGYQLSRDSQGDRYVFFGSSVGPECDSFVYCDPRRRDD